MVKLQNTIIFNETVGLQAQNAAILAQGALTLAAALNPIITEKI